MGDKGTEKPVDGKIIKKTQDSLGKIIKKPPLTDKLLLKPPFRFLHDIITSVIKQTGFMKGLFTETEMNSENVKDKDSKIIFLQKVIDMVSLVIGKAIAAKPSKIVAGHDADKTNELLQALAEAINKKVDNDDYVRRVLKTDDVAKPPQAANPTESTRSQNRDREEKKRSVEGGDKEKSGDRHKSRDRDSKDNEIESRSKDTKKDKDRDGHHRSRVEGGSNNDDKGRRENSLGQGDRRDTKKEDTDEQRPQRPTSAKGVRRQQSQDESKKETQLSIGNDDHRQSSAKNKSIRPSSARPAPPKPKKNEIISEEPVIMGVRKVPNVIVDKQDKSDDEENENDEIESDLLNVESRVESGVRRQTIDGEAEADSSHGGLVKKILEAKKEAESQPGKKTEIDRSQVSSDVTRRKEREVIQRDIDRLRASVQTLTRSVNPLGKILDFVQEDFDAMQKELDVWRRENNENIVALHREQSITESSIEPLNAQLSELDSAIRDHLDLIAAVKSTILHNDLKITKMLGSVTKS